ncbi:MAG: ferredoxin [Candidatus Buchananbacteria bacterium]
MSPKVNEDLCIGCGTCEAVCPAVFKIAEDGKAKVLAADYIAEADKIKESIESCPVQAISEE